MRVHRCLREEEKVRGVCVYHGDQISQRGTIGACFLGVNSEKLEALPLVGGIKQVMSRRVPRRLGNGRGVRSPDGEMSPVRFRGWGSGKDAVQFQWMWVLLGPGWKFRRRVREWK